MYTYPGLGKLPKQIVIMNTDNECKAGSFISHLFLSVFEHKEVTHLGVGSLHRERKKYAYITKELTLENYIKKPPSKNNDLCKRNNKRTV